MTDQAVTTIACDESGSEGENLMRSPHPHFVHASTNISVEEAQGFIERLRIDTRSQAVELKSTAVLLPRHRPALLRALRDFDGAANIALVDKAYFVASRMAALVDAEVLDVLGFSPARAGGGRDMASTLTTRLRDAVGDENWRSMMVSFNELVRAHRRDGDAQPTAEPFIAALERALIVCSDPKSLEMLEWLWSGQERVRAYEETDAAAVREMDPMFSSLVAVASMWAVRLDSAPISLLLDMYGSLTEAAQEYVTLASNTPLSIAGDEIPLSEVRGVRMVDSKSDARVQVADILAGVGREVGRLALAGEFDDDLQIVVHEMLDRNVMAATDSPLDVLIDRRPQRYMQRWESARSRSAEPAT